MAKILLTGFGPHESMPNNPSWLVAERLHETTILCNHLMYGVLHHIQSRALPIRAGWLHLPVTPETTALPENLNMPSMSVETSVIGLTAGIEAIPSHPVDSDEVSFSRFQI